MLGLTFSPNLADQPPPNPEHDIPIGGDCNAGVVAEVHSSQLMCAGSSATYSCTFHQPADNDAPIVVSVLCVLNGG
jgi:hypothetical protein